MATRKVNKKGNTKVQKNMKKKTQQTNVLKSKLMGEIVGLILILAGAFSLYTLIAKDSGAIGNRLYTMLFFLLGKSSFIFTLLFILLGVYFIVKGINSWKVNLFTILLFSINISITLTLIDRILLKNVFSMEIIDTAINTKAGGGLIGIFLASILVKLFSTSGTIIILVITTLICTILMTQKSIYESLVNGKEYLVKKFKKDPKLKEEKSSLTASTVTDPPLPETEVDKKIKILDYSEIRSKKNTEATVPKKEEKVKNSKEVESKIAELEKQASSGPLIHDNIHIDYQFPSIDLLKSPVAINSNSKKEILSNARLLEKTLKDFGVNASVMEVSMGPSVTRYELQLEPGIKVSKIINLSNDLALSLATTNVRIEAPIPGKAAVGIEVPNKTNAIVNIREVLESKVFKDHKSKICFALGKELSGSAVVGDLSKMPHMLIAGATGSGKSVCINSIITSILYKASPEEVKLILIDPKMVELNNYNGIPHLLIPVVTDPKHASGALNWAITEMTERYKLFKDSGVRDITRYNEVVAGKDNKMPKIVIIIDELADLMMVSPREVENAICRLAQLARAAGIHLVLATQRPSVDVITGLIKANVPSRISFAVSSMVDSRTILDMGGAEKLLGRGDMLYHPVGEAKPIRIQGTFISDIEVENVVDFVKKQGIAQYNEKVIEDIKVINVPNSKNDFEDDMLPQAIELTLESDTISTSMIQRKLRVGYSRAGRIIDEMEERDIISGPEGSKPRRVLLTKDEYYRNIGKTEE